MANSQGDNVGPTDPTRDDRPPSSLSSQKATLLSNPVLLVIAISAAVAALGTVVWLATWGYSAWQMSHIVSSIEDPVPDLEGTWRGTYSVSGKEWDVKLTITNSKPLSGQIDYIGSGCTGGWNETSRKYGTIYVDEKDSDVGKDCAGLSEWKLTVEGNTMRGTITFIDKPAETTGGKLAVHKD